MTQKARLLTSPTQWEEEMMNAKTETVEEYLARGGKITYCEPQHKATQTGYYNQCGSSALTSRRENTNE